MIVLLEKHWRAVGVLLALTLVLGLVAHLEGRSARQIAALQDENASLRKQIGTMVPAATVDELQRAQASRDKQFTSLIGTYQETFRILSQTRTATNTTTTIERTTERPPVIIPPPPGSPPGTPSTTTPAAPGTPLISPSQAPAAREAASERIVAHLDAGSLLAKCWPAPNAPDQLELLRDPQGRLASTSPCVASIDDTVRLTQPNAPSNISAFRLSYNVALPSFTMIVGPWGTAAVLGVTYQNLAYSGVYRVTPGWSGVWVNGGASQTGPGGVFTWEKPL